MTNNALDTNGVYGVNCLSSSPRVRWNIISRHQKGVFADASSLPDLGTLSDSGYNSILMSNTRWVESQSSLGSVTAQYNWWGTERPDLYPKRFVGSVGYSPWLTSPPGDGDGGGQSAGREDVIRPALYACRPNPFSDRTDIRFQLAQPGRVRLAVYTTDGRLQRTLQSATLRAGRYSATWDGCDGRGRRVPTGIYLYRLETPDFTSIRKAVVSR